MNRLATVGLPSVRVSSVAPAVGRLSVKDVELVHLIRTDVMTARCCRDVATPRFCQPRDSKRVACPAPRTAKPSSSTDARYSDAATVASGWLGSALREAEG